MFSFNGPKPSTSPRKHRKHRHRHRRKRERDLEQSRSDAGDFDIDSMTKPDVVHRTRVEQYSVTAGSMSGIATFAGAITLSTQLLIQCPNSRLQALLALASQLFLATPLVLLGVAAVLHGRRGDDPIEWDESSRAFIVAQFMIAGVMLIASFLLLGCAIYVADVAHHDIGRWGLVMISLIMVIIVVALWASNRKNRFWRSFFFRWHEYVSSSFQERSGRTGSNHGFYSGEYIRVFLATLVPQLVVVGCLIGFGARTAARAQTQFGCGGAGSSFANGGA